MEFGFQLAKNHLKRMRDNIDRLTKEIHTPLFGENGCIAYCFAKESGKRKTFTEKDCLAVAHTLLSILEAKEKKGGAS